MTSPLITGYVTGLHRKLPPAIAGEVAGGLTETYEHHLAAGAGDQEAARAAIAEFGDLAMVVGEFTRQAPGRQAARLLLATGPVVGGCWAAALILSRAWTWPVPATARLGFGAVLLLAVAGLAVAATSRHSYQRTRLATIGSPVILVLDATAVAVVAVAAPALTLALGTAVGVSLGRIAFTAWTLPHLAARYDQGWEIVPPGPWSSGVAVGSLASGSNPTSRPTRARISSRTCRRSRAYARTERVR